MARSERTAVFAATRSIAVAPSNIDCKVHLERKLHRPWRKRGS